MMEFFEKLWMNNSVLIREWAIKASLILIVILCGFFIVRNLKKFINNADKRFDNFDETVIPVIKSLASLFVYSVCLIVILDIFGFNTNSVIALFGAAGLAVALALKDTLSNIAAGIMLLILRPFQKGHYIEAGSVTGTVSRIDLFTTVLETADGLYISTPNKVLWNSSIKNYTKNGRRRIDLVVGISYEDSIDLGFKVLMEIAENEPRFFKDPAPRVMIQALSDSSVNIQLRAWTSTDDYWDVYWETGKKIKEKIEEAGLSIPFPQRVVHISEK